jgi:hypothetical protein
MPKPNGERELSTRGDTERRSAFGGQRDSETRPHLLPDVLHRKRLVCPEPFGVEYWRILMEPQCLVGRPV